MTGSVGCVRVPDHMTTQSRSSLIIQDAFGFIYTSILFSQHLYTLSIAIATFLLLVSHHSLAATNR